MKLKLSTIIGSQQALADLTTLSLPITVSYKISKLINRIQPDLKLYEEKRFELIKRLGAETGEGTNQFSVKPENLEEFQKELTTLLEMDIDVDFGEGKELEKIPVSQLSGTNIAAKDLIALDWLFTE